MCSPDKHARLGEKKKIPSCFWVTLCTPLSHESLAKVTGSAERFTAFLEVFQQTGLKFHTLWDSAGWETSYSKTTGVSTPRDHLDVQRFKQLDIQKNRNILFTLRAKGSFKSLATHISNWISTSDNIQRVVTEWPLSWCGNRSNAVLFSDIKWHLDRCKQLVLKDHQCLCSGLQWPQQALECSGKGSIEIRLWKAASIV